MPTVGEIKRASEIGYKGHAEYIWLPCEGCGLERWQHKNNVRKYCPKCARELLTLRRRPSDVVTKYASELGYYGRKKDNLMYQSVCPDCCKIGWKNHRYQIGDRCEDCSRRLHSIQLSNNRASLHPRWKGGSRVTNNGYVMVVIQPDSPYIRMAKKDKTANSYQVLEHRLVMAESLGRCLHTTEQVHHINGIKTDNRRENLLLVEYGKHNTALQSYVGRLEKKIEKLSILSKSQAKELKLLKWHIRDLRQGNAVLNSGNEPDKCVENIDSASLKQDDDMFHPQTKV